MLVVVQVSAALTVSALAQGCGPTRLKVSESVTLDMPPAKVWALIGNFQDLAWDPEAASTSGSGGNLPDVAHRIVVLKRGAAFGESLYKYDAEAMSYSYHIDTIDVATLPVQNVSATLEVVPAGVDKSTVRWKSAFYRYLTPGEGAPDAADSKAVKAMEAYLRSALAGLKSKSDPKT
jgi:hypothetical protein